MWIVVFNCRVKALPVEGFDENGYPDAILCDELEAVVTDESGFG